MSELVIEPVRLYPAILLLLAGISLIVAGLRSGPRRWLAQPGSPRALIYLYTFRRVIVGLALVGAGIGLYADVAWLFGVSVLVGIGEFLESSYYIGVLRWGQQHPR